MSAAQPDEGSPDGTSRGGGPRAESRSGTAGSGRGGGRWLHAAAVVLLVAGHFAMAYTAALRESNVFDEPLHQTGGYASWRFGDFRIHPENGNLPQRLFALPLVLGGERYRFPSRDSPAWRESAQWTIAHRFYFREGNDFRRMLASGRAVAACLGAAVVALVYGWSRRLFGPRGALLSAALAAFSPNLLAHGPLMTSDAILALLLPAFLGLLWVALHRATPAAWLGSAAVGGLLFVSKFSAPLVLPMAGLLASLRVGAGRPWPYRVGRRRGRIAGRGAQTLAVLSLLALHGVVIAATIWTVYDFRYAAMAEAAPGAHLFDSWRRLLAEPGVVTDAVAFAREHRLLPEAYLYGVAFVQEHTRARYAFLAGRFGVQGWWTFFPIAVAIKTPLALFALLGLAAASGRAVPRSARAGAYRLAPLAVGLAVYGAASLGASVNVGLRHVLPLYPLGFVLAGAAARWIGSPHRVTATAVALCALLFAAASWSIRPHYLAYFNVLVGPERGYRWLVDSSLDWGQDLPALARWLDANARPGEAVFLSYFGSSDPTAYGVDALALPSYHDWTRPGGQPAFALGPGLYCISATNLQAVYTWPQGPWTAAREARYRAVRAEVVPMLRGPLPAPARARWLRTKRGGDLYREYHALRFARLTAYLRRSGRRPDAMPGYSILVYRLGDDELHEALYGDLPGPRPATGPADAGAGDATPATR